MFTTMHRIGGRPSTSICSCFVKHESSNRLPFPLATNDYLLYFSARFALAAGIRYLGINEGETVLLPSYNCGIEIEPFHHFGIRTDFYRIKPDLTIDMVDIARRMCRGVKAVLVTHYLGFPQPLGEIRELCNTWNAFLIEDCAHALLSSDSGKFLGMTGDISVFSLLKTLPVPNGGVLVINNPKTRVQREECRPSVFSTLYYLADLKRQKTSSDNLATALMEYLLSSLFWRGVNAVRLAAAAVAKVTGIKIVSFVRPDSYVFNSEILNWGMSPLSTNIINTTNFELIKERRRDNFKHLLKRLLLSECRQEFGFPIETLPNGVCPLFFPLIVKGDGKREYLYLALKERGIASHPWWDRFHPAVPWEEFPEAVSLKERLFGIPIHQDLTFEHLDRIILELEKICRTWRTRNV
jgi:dTDP-4-amino-4,6-dideoxygalactose transaminase